MEEDCFTRYTGQQVEHLVISLMGLRDLLGRCSSPPMFTLCLTATNSLKSGTRSARIGSFTRSYHLTVTRDLPPKEICLTSIKTKETLIEIIAEELCKRFIENKSLNRLVITSGSHFLQEVKLGVRVSRMDLISFYEEADQMIPQQLQVKKKVQ